MQRKATLALLVAPLLLAGADAARPPAPAIAPIACPGIDGARVRTLIGQLFADHPETRAVALAVDGCAPVKVYADGYSDANRFVSWSMNKTVTAMLIGALVKDGRLALDAPVPLAEWHGAGDPHAAITLRNMLQMASGVRHIETGTPVQNSDTNQMLFVSGTQAMAAGALAQPLVHPPGTHWQYNTLTSVLLAEIATRAITQSRDSRTRAAAYTDFARQRLFAPAGVAGAVMDFDAAGTQAGGSLLYMSLDDWTRMGHLLLDGRGPGGVQVIAPDWLAFMKAPSSVNPQYGGQTWINLPSNVDGNSMFPGKGPPTTVAMIGHLGQMVIAAQGMVDGRPRRLVLVRLGNTAETAGMKQKLGDIVEALIPHDAAPIG